MRVRIIAVGTRMPTWVQEGFIDYTRRLAGSLPLTLSEIASAPRRGADTARARATEAERVLARVRPADFLVCLDEHGRELDTRELADWLAKRMQAGRDVTFAIGGPDGLAPPLLERADFSWSLSRLTLPHALVRVLLAEQLYRAHALLRGHPYHRE
ncbi:MAG TPA: 23S rRNA (pseudouridine(1915)-N(3))-methyltransferase RlmH [Steroidobacteraceae bacterium]|nr:23S rRNA (pseudouridine(1915)-N(3))-methyltransferase RlmH [Steroidobacteraceae bacterium]